MTLIKICGIQDPATVTVLNQFQPDFVGFVFAPSRRRVSFEQALELRQLLDPAIQTVGVFVNADFDAMLELVQAGIISHVQLHGDEDEGLVKRLQAAGAKVIQVRHQITESHPTTADLIMYDGGAGTATRLDWQPFEKAQQPQILAGGLTPENVGRALQATRADGVDVSSGVETAGEKDPQKIAEFIMTVRAMEEEQ